ncbi:DUF1330 domain-containing protein [Pseudonocardia sp. NPDC046786]|uniref:DUF1330 domain-containing protein n=1 Tax=Pseudonocardia sp. NPDC046786 TaxID=3155471 RepID=UPI0033FD74C8
MSAYLIYFCHEFRDKAGHVAYSNAVKATLEGTGATVHSAYTHLEVLEGEDIQGVVLIEFPTFGSAKKWYDSPEYAAVRGHRIRNSYTGVLVAGGVTPLKDRFPHVP